MISTFISNYISRANTINFKFINKSLLCFQLKRQNFNYIKTQEFFDVHALKFSITQPTISSHKKTHQKTSGTLKRTVAGREGFEPSRRFPDLQPQQGRLFDLLSISPCLLIFKLLFCLFLNCLLVFSLLFLSLLSLQFYNKIAFVVNFHPWLTCCLLFCYATQFAFQVSAKLLLKHSTYCFYN